MLIFPTIFESYVEVLKSGVNTFINSSPKYFINCLFICLLKSSNTFLSTSDISFKGYSTVKVFFPSKSKKYDLNFSELAFT